MPTVQLRNKLVPPSLRGSVACDVRLIPRYWLTIYADGYRAHYAKSTNSNTLSVLSALYETASDVSQTDLDVALTQADYQQLSSILSAHLQRLSNASKQKRVDRTKAWSQCINFVQEVLKQIGAADAPRWEQVQHSLQKIAQTMGQLSPARQKAPAPIRALPAVVLDELYQIFDPKNDRNPFRSEKEKVRNFLIFLLLLHLGLRRGELLVLDANSFQTEFNPKAGRDVNWLVIDYLETSDDTDDLPDPRSNPASLKNNLARRLLPISEAIATVNEAYLGGYRRKSDWSHLIVSQKNKPLSSRRLNEIFQIVTSALSSEAEFALRKRGKSSVQPHDLRHTAAVRRLSDYRSSGFSHSESIEKLRTFFGWHYNSPMPTHYARAYYETEFDGVWQDNYDTYVDAIRALETKQ